MYIEYVIIDNFIINFLLLKVSMASSRVKTSKLKLCISAGVGTVVAVVMPLFKISGAFLVLIKINLGLLMVLIAGEYLTVKKLGFTLLFFLSYTFLSGGMIIGLFYLSGVDFIVYFSVNYNSFMPVGISVLLVYLFTKLTLYLITNLLKSRDIKPFIRKCVIVISGKKFKVNGYIDSGNRLFDKNSGLPIIVASKSLFLKLNSGEEKLIPKSQITVNTVNGESVMKIYAVDKLLIYNGEYANIINNVMITDSQFDFERGEEYDVLLNPSLI